MLLPGPKPGEGVCMLGGIGEEQNTGGPPLPSIALCLALGVLAFRYEAFS